ncbi:hypothetical protein NDU88_007479 [Pleurodeles waltl]|uniref:Uncharacterized protein n=1 Tax=Pleurodeles waltl TaxID=8319 RepID=A0AAV7QN77_PLEWA|nr:hypothetical protein NDU88_007479 [Pleurodeles waltl]
MNEWSRLFKKRLLVISRQVARSVSPDRDNRVGPLELDQESSVGRAGALVFDRSFDAALLFSVSVARWDEIMIMMVKTSDKDYSLSTNGLKAHIAIVVSAGPNHSGSDPDQLPGLSLEFY